MLIRLILFLRVDSAEAAADYDLQKQSLPYFSFSFVDLCH